jgi:hypothetical protein
MTSNKTGSAIYILPGDDSCNPFASVSPVMQDLFYRHNNNVLYVIDTSHTEVKAYWGKVTVSSSF